METGCDSASEAYRISYPRSKLWKDETVWSKASALLNSDKVQVRINQLKEKLEKKSDITKERILHELTCIIKAKITDYLDFDGEVLKFKSFSSLTEDQVRAIEGIKEGKNGLELKLHGKSWTIERICKMLGYDSPEVHEMFHNIKPPIIRFE